ncbi:high mobility group protein D-like [Anastrepha ludens]|uniref:high mobility group protein D-like n=1 Tax=Anastrepha ludens TaxID=28586 RepID=UPI0023AFD1E6|nr:high mobility group protein D-like [Anastrepha ludens]
MSDKPKRPLSAYMLWLNAAREQIKRENPGIKVTEVAKKGGELWRSMKDKSEWEAKAAKAKEDFDEAVREFEAHGGSCRIYIHIISWIENTFAQSLKSLTSKAYHHRLATSTGISK